MQTLCFRHLLWKSMQTLKPPIIVRIVIDYQWLSFRRVEVISHPWPLLVFCFCISGIVKIVKLGNDREIWPKCFHLDEFVKLDQDCDCDCDRTSSMQKSLPFVLIFWSPHCSQSTMQDMPDDRRLPPKRPSHCPRRLHPPCSGWQSRKKSAIGNRIGEKGRIGRECNGKSRNPAKVGRQ